MSGSKIWVLLATLALAMSLSPAQAHDNHHHHGSSEPPPEINIDVNGKQDELPINVDFRSALPLTDQSGAERTFDDLAQTPVLLFFGYAHCEGICLAALPLMAQATELLAKDNLTVQPVMITIDPARDTKDTLGDNLAKYSPRFIGLTGDEDELERAREAFNILAKPVMTDANGGTVYKHGTFVYLLDEGGKLLTVVPPVLPPEKLAMVVRNNIAPNVGN